MNQLTRVQVYLDPDNLAIIDNIAKDIKVTRSKIIREAIQKHVKKFANKKKTVNKKPKKSALMEMAGIEVSKTGTVGLNIDDIYLTPLK